MDTANRRLQERIEERLEAIGLTERAASLAATGQPDTLRYIRTRNVVPSALKLAAIAKVLKTSASYLTGLTDTPDPEGVGSISAEGADRAANMIMYHTAALERMKRLQSRSIEARALGEWLDRENRRLEQQKRTGISEPASPPPDLPPEFFRAVPSDVPLYEVSFGGLIAAETTGGHEVEVTATRVLPDVERYIPRPRGLPTSRGLFAFTPMSDSLAALAPGGEPAMFRTVGGVQDGDPVALRLADGGGDLWCTGILRSRSGDHVALVDCSDGMTVIFPTGRVAELVGLVDAGDAILVG